VAPDYVEQEMAAVGGARIVQHVERRPYTSGQRRLEEQAGARVWIDVACQRVRAESGTARNSEEQRGQPVGSGHVLPCVLLRRYSLLGTKKNKVNPKWLLLVGVLAALDSAVSAQRVPRPPDIFFAPTWEPVVYEMLKLAEVTAEDVVYDLGSGDGRIVVLAAQRYGARGVGIEIDRKLIEISRQVAREAEVDDKVAFIEGDLFAADISRATVVTLYLSASVNRELEPKLRRELRPGTRIVSHQFPIGDWAPERTVRATDGTDLFLWRVASPNASGEAGQGGRADSSEAHVRAARIGSPFAAAPDQVPHAVLVGTEE